MSKIKRILFVLIGFAFAANLSADYYTGKIFPTPQYVVYSGTHFSLNSKRALLITAPNLANRNLLATELVGKITGLGGSISEEKAGVNPDDFSIVISVGETALYNKYKESEFLMPPDQAEGYQIKLINNGKRCIWFLSAHDDTGYLWAVKSLCQLISKKGNAVLLRAATVYDYPAFRRRVAAVSMAASKEYGWDMEYFARYSKKLVDYKYNDIMPVGFHFLNNYLGLADTMSLPDARYLHWRKNYEDSQLTKMKELNDFFKERGIALSVALGPAKGGKCYQDAVNCTKIRISDKAQVEQLLSFIRQLAKNGILNISLWLDDVSLPLPVADKEYFGNAGKAHVYLVNTIYETMKKEFPGFQMSFCSALYMTTAKSEVLGHPVMDVVVEEYWKSLRENISKDVLFTWNGRYVCSSKITSPETVYMKTILDKELMLLDFGWSGHFLESYHFDAIPIARRLSPDIHKYLLGYAFPINAYPQNEIILAQLADYLWNPDAFDAVSSRNEIVERLLGPGMLPLVTEWNEKIGYFDKYSLRLSPGAVDKVDELDVKLKELHELHDRILKASGNNETLSSLKFYLDKLDKYSKGLRSAKFPDADKELQKLEGCAKKEAAFSEDDIFLPAVKFFGGNVGRVAYKCDPRYASWVYAPKTAATMSVEFTLDKDLIAKSSNPVFLLCAQDDEIESQCKIEISVNGKSIFEGRNEFPRFGWGVKGFPVKSEFLKEGKNVIEIKNAEEGDSIHGAPWFMACYGILRLK